MSKKTYEDGVMDCLNTINDFWHDWNEAYHESIRQGKPGPAKEFKNKMVAASEINMDINATLLEVEMGRKINTLMSR